MRLRYPASAMHEPTTFRFAVLQLDDQAVDACKDRLTSLAEATGAGDLHLDFAQVEWISSTALSMLIGLHRRLARSERHLVLCNVGASLIDLFRLTRLDSLFDIRATRPATGRSVSASA